MLGFDGCCEVAHQMVGWGGDSMTLARSLGAATLIFSALSAVLPQEACQAVGWIPPELSRDAFPLASPPGQVGRAG
jgi:hypothetical protein